MTEKKQLPEQIASHIYKQPSNVQQVGVARSSYKKPRSEAVVHGKPEASRSLQRVVTIPEADPSIAWNTFAERQEQRRRARARPQRNTDVALRTYAQTGMRASSGRIKAIRQSLPAHHSSPIPIRSGRRTSQRGLFWKVLSALSGIVVLVLAANFALTSNAFRITQVNVNGTRNDKLIQSIQHMGLQGQNIFFVNVAALNERVETLPAVATASLSKQWPNQITVTVTERVPVLLWQTAQGIYSIDREGVVIASAQETPGAERLNTVVSVVSAGQGTQQSDKATTPVTEPMTVQPGTHLNQPDILFALDVFNLMPQFTGGGTFKLRYDAAAGVARDQANPLSKGGYILDSSKGWSAYLGGAADSNPLENRLAELEQILVLAQKEQLPLATIDLRYGLRPVYTLKS